MKIDTQLTGALGSVGAEARRLHELGFDGGFTFEGPADLFPPLVEAALAGGAAGALYAGLDLYTNVAISFPRSPMHLAYTAWDLQRLTGGHFALGLGTQVKPHIERRYSAVWDRPVARMREQVLAVKSIFACWQDGTPLDFRGEFFTHTLMTPIFDPGPLEWGPPPVWVGAVGPKLTTAVAEVADGLLLHPFHTEAFLREHTLPLVAMGLDHAGRDPAAFDLGIDVIVCTGRDAAEQEAADAGVRMLLSFYGSTPAYKPVLDLHGWGDLQPELNRLTKSGEWDRMPELITDEHLDVLSVRGTPSEVGGKLVARYDDVAARVGFYMPYAADDAITAEIITTIKHP